MVSETFSGLPKTLPEGAPGGPRSLSETSQKRPETLPEAPEQC